MQLPIVNMPRPAGRRSYSDPVESHGRRRRAGIDIHIRALRHHQIRQLQPTALVEVGLALDLIRDAYITLD
jgi:hypothetical protein